MITNPAKPNMYQSSKASGCNPTMGLKPMATKSISCNGNGSKKSLGSKACK